MLVFLLFFFQIFVCFEKHFSRYFLLAENYRNLVLSIAKSSASLVIVSLCGVFHEIHSRDFDSLNKPAYSIKSSILQWAFTEMQFSVGVNALLMINERTFSFNYNIAPSCIWHACIPLLETFKKKKEWQRNVPLLQMHICAHNVCDYDSDTNAFTKSICCNSHSIRIKWNCAVAPMDHARDGVTQSDNVFVHLNFLFIKWRDFSCTFCHFTVSTVFGRKRKRPRKNLYISQ